MAVEVWFNPGLRRTPANAKRYDAQIDVMFPERGNCWKRAGLLNDFDYTPIRFEGGRRIGSGFLSSSVLAFDYDHVFEEGLLTDRDPAEVQSKVESAMGLKGENLCYMAVPSHRLNGMHIFLPLDTAVRDPSLYKNLYRYVVSTHPLLDQQVKDLGRFFYGSALDPETFKKYALFRRGALCPVNVLASQMREEEAKRLLRAKREARRRAMECQNEGSLHEVRPFDWDRWEWGEGTRNVSLYKSACSILARRYPNAEEEWHAKAASTGLSDREIEGIWKSAKRFTGVE